MALSLFTLHVRGFRLRVSSSHPLLFFPLKTMFMFGHFGEIAKYIVRNYKVATVDISLVMYLTSTTTLRFTR